MASVKVVLHPRPKADGTLSLALRITKGTKSSYIFLGYSILREQWDPTHQKVKKTHPNSSRLNNLIAKKLAEASDAAIETETHRPESSSMAISQKLKPKVGASFFEQAELLLENLKSTGRYNQYVADKPRVKHFREFLGNADVIFTDVTPALLSRYRVWLKATRGSEERTIVNHLMVVRAVFAQAIKAELVDQKFYPFGAGKVKLKFPESAKIGLCREIIEILENLELKSQVQHQARNLWLFSYYFAGMRVSDVLRLKWSDFRQGRLYYTMGKNKKPGSLKVPEKALALLAECSRDHELVFPQLRVVNLKDAFAVQRQIGFATKDINNALRYVKTKAGIDCKLTMHIARHTFAQLSADKIPVQTLQKLYRHSNIQTTMGYQSQFIVKDVDDALDSVLNG